MVLSPTACIWFLPVVLALLPDAQPVSEAWLQPLDLSPSWGLTVPHLSLHSAFLSLDFALRADAAFSLRSPSIY